jgi:predicted acylesterase/phospholipase RssA
MVSEAAASAPLLVYEGALERPDHPLAALLARPNPRQERAAFLEAVCTHLLLAGNAYIEAVALTEGDTVTAILASSAFPGAYPPVQFGGRTLIDGGVVADVPLDLAKDLGAASALVLSVPPLSHGDVPSNAIEILLRSSSMGVEAHGRTALRRPPEGLHVAEIPATPSPLGTFDVGKTVAMIDEGYAAASAWLRRSATGW